MGKVEEEKLEEFVGKIHELLKKHVESHNYLVRTNSDRCTSV